MAKARDQQPELNTAQRLGSILKSARDIMRKDKGLNGDLDRLPMITWLLFLKFLDDSERVAEEEAELSDTAYSPLIVEPYRWRDWAGPGTSITGPELLAFINQEEAVLPDGHRGPGLLTHLRALQSESGSGRQEVVANVFRGVVNRMESGYLLRDVLEKLDGVHFDSSDEIHTLGHLYESMLREMRDAAGDSGEFYTPRPVIRFMVSAVDPILGETVLDPACGTGGFLVQTYQHLEPSVRSVRERRALHERTLLGQEAKPLPYMLAQMNLLLHGIEYPNVIYGNSLTTKITEIGDKDRVDVILTNPPFGGEEEAAVKNNFPADMQTAETALLFLQLIMRKLQRATPRQRGGRAAVVVPDGILFQDGVAARIKGSLLRDFNLHTIVRLPNGVFAPYTGIPTNILFFDRTGPTKHIWYYVVDPPEGRKNYSKTKPMRFEEFADCLAWWPPDARQENEHAWRVAVDDVLRVDDSGSVVSANLDLKNPRSTSALEHMPPKELLESILTKERAIVDLLEELERDLRRHEQ